MEVHPNLRAGFAKSGEVSGPERVRPLRYIAGENRTRTTHREQGSLFKVDLSRVFFSPRLSTDHQRVELLVAMGERVVEMFAGAVALSMLITKGAVKVHVMAIDANPHAID